MRHKTGRDSLFVCGAGKKPALHFVFAGILFSLPCRPVRTLSMSGTILPVFFPPSTVHLSFFFSKLRNKASYEKRMKNNEKYGIMFQNQKSGGKWLK